MFEDKTHMLQRDKVYSWKLIREKCPAHIDLIVPVAKKRNGFTSLVRDQELIKNLAIKANAQSCQGQGERRPSMMNLWSTKQHLSSRKKDEPLKYKAASGK